GGSGVAFVGDPKAVRNPLFEYRQHQSYGAIDKTPGPQTDDYPADCAVEDCLITRIGRVEKQAAGVEISMARHIAVRHCSIYEVPRAGINVGDGCWGGHLVEGCDIFDTVLETGDHGSFNAWGRDRYWRLDGVPAGQLPSVALLDAVEPIVIRNNRWRCDHGWDIDLDDGSSNYEISSNLMLNGGLKLREGFARKAWNNITVNNSLCPHVWFPDSGDVVVNNIFMDALKPAAMKTDLQKWGKEVDHNFYTSGEDDRRKFLDKGCDTNSLSGDPHFVDAAHGDFRVRDDSGALKAGFRNFPMDQFGVQKPSLKAIARTPVIPPLNLKPEPVAAPGKIVLWKGASLRNLSGEEFSAVGVARDANGVYIADVPAGSEAERAGLRSNDFIQMVDQKPVKNADEFLGTIRTLPVEQKIKLRIIRNQKVETLELTAGPAN
ncbi:MAG TPA: PDZ domain-containing protein, partial [Desulfuromonadaceae bacterium]|nr:PDZ domain-containing protein [Desulfuromonadaceae bacterium]